MNSVIPTIDRFLDLAAVIPEKSFEPFVPPELVGHQIPVPNRVIRYFSKQSETFFAFSQGGLGAFLFGNVRRHGQYFGDVALFRVEWRGGRAVFRSAGVTRFVGYRLPFERRAQIRF